MENKEKKKEDDWIRQASKSRPGRFYMFNKATGETQWLPQREGEIEQCKQESPPKLSIKANKTPAQDRLKRLQHNLKITQTRPQSSRSTRHSTKLESNTINEQENRSKELPSTSSSVKDIVKSPKRAIKRPPSTSLSTGMQNSGADIKTSSFEEAKKLRISESSNINPTTSVSSKLSVENAAIEASKPSKFLGTTNNIDEIANVEEHSSSSLNNLRTGIVNKIKKICKIPFNMSKKVPDEKTNAKDEKLSSLINTNQFKPGRKTKGINQRLSISACQEATKQLKEENAKTSNIKMSPNVSEFSTPKNSDKSIPSYPRGSANSRLERLKQSLLSQQSDQQQPCKTASDSNVSNQICNLSSEINNNKTTLWKSEDNQNTKPINSLHDTANNTFKDGIEAMDWQPITKDEESIEASSSEHSLVIEKSKKLPFQAINANKNESMGDIYDTVNENLLRFSAEKHKDAINSKKWQKDFYYFIVDTNVLLRDLTFVEDLTKMKLCDTEGSMLFIPYSVLQELDKLKMRSGCQEGVKTLAVRAIKYLNSKFENNSSHLQAQSALDERRRLVDINSADDSIINCCLQAKEHVPNLLLLTEDVNLRNKAICNNILVSTKSDLISKRYDSNNTDDKT